LFFVISLLILVSFRKRLITTITSFTVAHSITLALSALELISLRSAPVEATIALSIVLVCYEILKNPNSLTHRMPELVAFVFGLLHGLGFAGALKEIGLPQQNIITALFSFNIGVEAGQLLVLLLAWVTYLASHRVLKSNLPIKKILTYCIGSISMYWTISRIALIFNM
ncbi:MAG: HupE/UreJ family protein, partial [Gammaproteobacteria bacterium]|nr:HupE/UreJ family protein [Gammaproteobacteria bacterium]